MSDNPFINVPLKQLQDLKVFVVYDEQGDALAYTLWSLDNWMQNNMVTVVHAGVRIAVAVVLGVVLAAIARSYKSLMFALYELNMVLMLISSALELAFNFGLGHSITMYTTGGEMPNYDLRLGMATTVFQMLLALSLLASLVVQIHTAHSDQKRLIRYSVVVLAIIGCFPTFFIWMWRTVLVGIADTNPEKASQQWSANTTPYKWVHQGAWPAFAASTSFCSLILCVKLWLVHRKRAALGLNHYDPIKIIFVMAIQNSAIPAILAIVSACFSSDNFSAQSVSAASIVLTAALLPTGYIWAQFEILKGSSNQEHMRPSRPRPIDKEKAQSCVHTLSDSHTGASTQLSQFSEEYFSE